MMTMQRDRRDSAVSVGGLRLWVLVAVLATGGSISPADTIGAGSHTAKPRQNGPVRVSGVGGAHVGMSVRRVERLWHTALHPVAGASGSAGCRSLVPARPGAKPVLTFTNGRLTAIWYHLGVDRQVHTGLGLGYGASAAQVRRLYRAGLVWHPDASVATDGSFTFTKARPDVGLRFTMLSDRLTAVAYGRFDSPSCDG